MADDINNNEGMDEAGDAGMPDDLKRLLARAEQGEDGDPDAYNPDADDDEEERNRPYYEALKACVSPGARLVWWVSRTTSARQPTIACRHRPRVS